jgi:uncharacterized SAM-binding protein YcdF (DUF218 family)
MDRTFLRRHRRVLMLGLLVVLWAILAAREYRTITSEPVSSWKVDVSADCAVVLTGGSNRVREGFDLLARGQVKKLIISGVYNNAQLREIMPLWPFYGTLQEKDVVLDRRSSTTYGNAQQTIPLVEALGCRDIILVTSSLHMDRAYRTFVAAYPKDFPIYKHAVDSGRSENGLIETSTEVMKSLFYSLWAY